LSKREQRREAAREQILMAAARAIAKHGYHGMSMRKLARATDRSLANFYNYFSSKDEVLFALHSRAFGALIGAVEDLLDGCDDPVGELYLFIANHVGYFVEHSDVMRVLVYEAVVLQPKHRKQVRKLKERYFRIARDIVGRILESDSARGRDEAVLERATYSVFGMMNWVYAWYEPKRHGSARDVVRAIHHMAIQGLGVSPTLNDLQDALEEQLARDDKLPSPIRSRDGAAA